jgi:Family of unknown function (DUF6533)
MDSTVTGAMVMFYDHLITFDDEYHYIWKAPASFGKYAFLLSRYLVSGVGIFRFSPVVRSSLV